MTNYEYKPPAPLDWLKDTPPSDVNFKSALKNATMGEIIDAINYRETRPKNATAVKTLRAELGKRLKVNWEADNARD
jgi:hypothetical protein